MAQHKRQRAESELTVPTSTEVIVNRWRDGQVERVADRVAEEVPVALTYHGISHVVMLATPSDLEDLAAGFTLSEASYERKRDPLARSKSPRRRQLRSTHRNRRRALREFVTSRAQYLGPNRLRPVRSRHLRRRDSYSRARTEQSRGEHARAARSVARDPRASTH